jgi:hypothetical protein
MIRTIGNLLGDQYTLLITSRSIIIKMRNLSEKRCRENQNMHIMLNHFFSKTVPFMRKCEKKISSRTGQRRQYGARAVQDGYLRLQTQLSMYKTVFLCNNG